MNQPVQVMREFAIAKEVAQLNAGVQQQIVLNNPKAVFQYYQLVNVQWDQSQPPKIKPNAIVPFKFSSQSNGNLPVDNTTLETYAQKQSCVSCHAFAKIAGSDKLAADFSFIFLETQATMAELRRAPHLIEQHRIKDVGKPRP